jgi:hypothetical protein
VRHAKNVAFRHVEITSIQTDARPFVWLSDVDRADFSRLSLSPRDGIPALRLHEISNLRVSGSRGLPDTFFDHVTDAQFPSKTFEKAFIWNRVCPPATPTLQAASELKGLIEATNSSRALASSGPPNITPRAFAAKAALVVGVATMTMWQRKL